MYLEKLSKSSIHIIYYKIFSNPPKYGALHQAPSANLIRKKNLAIYYNTMSKYIFFRRLRLLLCSTCFPPTHHVIVACGLAPIASHLIWWDFPADKVFPWSRSFTTEGPSESRKWQIHHPSLKKYVLRSRNSRKQMWKTNACCKMFERVKKNRWNNQ